jgi:hypothetical protein
MRKYVVSILTVAAIIAFAFGKDAYDIRPDAAKPTDAPTSVEWENANDGLLSESTSDDVLEGFVASESSARSLLAQAKGAYATDPVAACQIAAVTQWVMLPDAWYWLWLDGPHAAGRQVWVSALLQTLKGSDDDYVAIFCLDQLRWCARPDDAKRIADMVTGKSSPVVDFSRVVIRELDSSAKGN